MTELFIKIFLFIHLLGMAALLGGTLSQIKSLDKKINPLMRDGAFTQLLTGIVLVGLLQLNNEEILMPIIAIKIILLFTVLYLVIKGMKKLSLRSYYLILIISLIEVGLALFVTK